MLQNITSTVKLVGTNNDQVHTPEILRSPDQNVGLGLNVWSRLKSPSACTTHQMAQQ